MRTVTIPGLVVQDLASSAYELIGLAGNKMAELAERGDHELHPEWWEAPFAELDSMRALLAAIGPICAGHRDDIEVDVVHVAALERATRRSLPVNTDILATAVAEKVDGRWVEARSALVAGLAAFQCRLASGPLSKAVA